MLDGVAQATDRRGIWVVDRSGDRKEITGPLLERGREFLIRMRDDRHVVIGRGRELKEVREVAAGCRRRFRTTVLKEEAKNEKVFPLGFGGCGVRFPGHEKKFFLVVIDGYGNERRTSPAFTSGAGRS